MISDSWVLTSARCVFEKKLKHIKIILGAHSLEKPGKQAKTELVSRVEVHPDYARSSPPIRYLDDVALVQLEKSVAINEFMWPACLAEMESLGELSNKFLVAGFGQSWTGGSSVHQAELDFIPLKSCMLSYGEMRVNENNFCAKSKGR